MFKTRDKDYTGCNPDIAKALKNNKEIFCALSARCNGFVRDYIIGHDKPYVTRTEHYKTATPVVVKQRVKKASVIVKWLEDHGYEVDEVGDWENKVTAAFAAEMFQHCGLAPHPEWEWLPEWLEEVTE
jgi:hypothetical protein